MWVIFKKELLSYFTHAGTYIIAVLFLISSGLLLWYMDGGFNILSLGKASLERFFELAPWLLVFLVPALSMRSISEEWSSGALSWLFTQPIKTRSLVYGKFGALKVLIIFLLLPTLVYVYSIRQMALQPELLDIGQIVTAYFGLYLLAIVFASIGMLCSSATKNQLLVYITALFFCFIIFFGIKGLATYDLLNENDFWVQRLGMSYHYDNFVKGILDSRSLSYFVFLSFIFLSLTDMNIQKRKN